MDSYSNVAQRTENASNRQPNDVIHQRMNNILDTGRAYRVVTSMKCCFPLFYLGYFEFTDNVQLFSQDLISDGIYFVLSVTAGR